MDIVCLGELLVDMFPAELGRPLAAVSAFHPKPGGAPANVAVAAARLGARSAFIGKVGDEAFGRHLASILADEGVETRGMRFDREARTTLAFIAQPDENTSEFVFYRNPGADMMLRADELDRALVREAKAFHFGSISLIQEPSRRATLEALEIAREAGALVSFDVNYRPTLWDNPHDAYERMMDTIPLVDLLKVNEVEVSLLTEGAARDSGVRAAEVAELKRDPVMRDDGLLMRATRQLLDLGPRLCVVTLGPQGSLFQTAKGGDYVPPFRVGTVDATGCGDAFVAGLLCQLVLGGDWRERLSLATVRTALRFANAVGALTSLKRGVIPALPTAEQVTRFLQGEGGND
jgi:fructokinase